MARRKKNKKKNKKGGKGGKGEGEDGEGRKPRGLRSQEEIAKRKAEARFKVPSFAEEERRKGNKEYHRKAFQQAVYHYTQGIANSARNPTFLVVLFANRAAAHIGLKAYDQCVDDCTAAIALDKNSVKAHGRRAYAYYCMKRYWEAVRDYEIALELDPDNTQVRDNLQRACQSLQAQSKKAAALEGQKKAEVKPKPDVKKPEASPSKPVELPPLILCEYRFDDSLSQDFDSDNVPLSNRARAVREKELGNTAVNANDFQTALAHYTNAINLNSQESVFFSNRALVHLKLGRFFDAIHDCSKSLELRASIKAHARRGTAWMSLHQYDKAADDFECALRFERRNQECLTGLEKCLQHIETQCLAKMKEDEVKYQALLETTRTRMLKWGFDLRRDGADVVAPIDSVAMEGSTEGDLDGDGADSATADLAGGDDGDDAGDVPLSEEELEQCVEGWTRTIAREPQNSTAYLERGIAYRHLNKLRQALEDFKSGLRLDPDNVDLHRELKATRVLLPQTTAQS